MIYVHFGMTIRDGEMEYRTNYTASINAYNLTDKLIEDTLIRECAMAELDIDPEDPDNYEIHEDGKIEAHNGDYRWVWIDSIVRMTEKEFNIFTKFESCCFPNLEPVTEAFKFR